MSSKIRMSALISKSIFNQVKNHSKNYGITQSKIIEDSLYNWLQIRLENDTKELAKINFEDIPTEDEWLEVQSNFN